MQEQQIQSGAEHKTEPISHDSSALANAENPDPSPAILLKQYEILVETHKHHLDLVLKLNIFHYALTGGILSFYFAQKYEPVMNLALALPFIMSLAFSIFCFYAASSLETTEEELERIKKNLRLIAYPDIRFLKYALWLSGGLFAVIALGLIIIACVRLAAS